MFDFVGLYSRISLALKKFVRDGPDPVGRGRRGPGGGRAYGVALAAGVPGRAHLARARRHLHRDVHRGRSRPQRRAGGPQGVGGLHRPLLAV
ncbi:unnamed protein product, partial [Prorocentrum cordatum]